MNRMDGQHLMTRAVAPSALAARTLAEHYARLGGLRVQAPDQRAFSIAGLLFGQERDAVEREIANKTAEKFRGSVAPMGPQIPWEYLALGRRDMMTTPGSAGGYLVGTGVLDPVDILRPWSVVVQGGMQVMSGLINNETIPRTLTAPAGAWVGESVAPTSTGPTYGSVSITPKTYVGVFKASTQFLRQSPMAEPFLRRQILRAVGRAIDTAVFAGAGATQPLGVVNTPGVGSVAGGTLDWADIAATLELLADAGLDDREALFVGSPDVRELLMVREKAADTGEFIWDTRGGDNVAGRTAIATPDMADATMVAGDFSQALLALWGDGPEVVVSQAPSAQDFAAGLVGIRVTVACDVAFPQPGAFVKVTSIS